MCDVRVKKNSEMSRYGLIFAEPLGFQKARLYGYKVLGVTNLNTEAPREHTRTAVGERLNAKDHNSHVLGYYFLLIM